MKLFQLSYAGVIAAMIGLVGGVAMSTPAFAQDMTCSEADLAKLQAKIEKITRTDVRTRAMKAMLAARESMAKHDIKVCMEHMHEASGIILNF